MRQENVRLVYGTDVRGNPITRRRSRSTVEMKDKETHTDPTIQKFKDRDRVRAVDEEKGTLELTPGRKQTHWLFPVGIGMIIVLLVWVCITSFILPSIQNIHDQWGYGTSRISQFDLHSGHWIAQDYQGKLLLIQFQGNNKAFVYTGPNIPPNKVVILEEQDVNGDGKVDIIVKVEGETIADILYNDGKGGYVWTLHN